jgi:two-component system, chemotaxis family, chemotaxis protein CheY
MPDTQQFTVRTAKPDLIEYSQNPFYRRTQLMDLSMKILIVDDFATMRRIMKNILKQIGFSNIIEADDGTTALEELKKNAVDLIISDWNMPKMTGLDLLKSVRGSDGLKDVPFLMVTAEAQKQNVIDAVQAGVTNYVVKPFTAEAISEKLEKIFGK